MVAQQQELRTTEEHMRLLAEAKCKGNCVGTGIEERGYFIDCPTCSSTGWANPQLRHKCLGFIGTVAPNGTHYSHCNCKGREYILPLEPKWPGLLLEMLGKFDHFHLDKNWNGYVVYVSQDSRPEHSYWRINTLPRKWDSLAVLAEAVVESQGLA